MTRKRQAPLVIGHRGCSYPGFNQNTIRSYEKIFEEGATAFEFDVQKTLDGALVVVHNLLLDNVSTGTGPVSGTPSDHIDELWAGKKETGKDRIPYLSQVIDLMASYRKESRPTMHLELKGTGAGEPTGAMLRTAIETGRIGREDILVSSFDWDELRSCSAACPHVPLALLAGAIPYKRLQQAIPNCDPAWLKVFGNLSERNLHPQRPTIEENRQLIDRTCPDTNVRSLLYTFVERALDGSLYDEDLLDTAEALQAKAVNLWHRSATVSFMHKAQDRGLGVQLYTVNDPEEIRTWTKAGVDGLFTDDYRRTQAIVDTISSNR